MNKKFKNSKDQTPKDSKEKIVEYDFNHTKG